MRAAQGRTVLKTPWDFSSFLVGRGNPTGACLGDSVLDLPTPLYYSPVGESTLVLGRDWAMLRYHGAWFRPDTLLIIRYPGAGLAMTQRAVSTHAFTLVHCKGAGTCTITLGCTFMLPLNPTFHPYDLGSLAHAKIMNE